MVRAECKAMCVRDRHGVGSMIGLLRSGAGGWRALSGVFGVVREWGKGRSLVPACRHRSHRKDLLAVTFNKAIARAEPSRSRRLLEPFPVTFWKCSPDGFPSTDRCSQTAPSQHATA